MTQKSGIFQENFKPSVRPQDDMYRHVNGGWLDSAEIPSDRAADGAFYFLRDESEKNVRAIIEELAASGGPQGSNAQKIGTIITEKTAAGAHATSGVVKRLTEGIAESSVLTTRDDKKLFAKWAPIAISRVLSR